MRGDVFGLAVKGGSHRNAVLLRNVARRAAGAERERDMDHVCADDRPFQRFPVGFCQFHSVFFQILVKYEKVAPGQAVKALFLYRRRRDDAHFVPARFQGFDQPKNRDRRPVIRLSQYVCPPQPLLPCSFLRTKMIPHFGENILSCLQVTL